MHDRTLESTTHAGCLRIMSGRITPLPPCLVVLPLKLGVSLAFVITTLTLLEGGSTRFHGFVALKCHNLYEINYKTYLLDFSRLYFIAGKPPQEGGFQSVGLSPQKVPPTLWLSVSLAPLGKVPRLVQPLQVQQSGIPGSNCSVLFPCDFPPLGWCMTVSGLEIDGFTRPF